MESNINSAGVTKTKDAVFNTLKQLSRQLTISNFVDFPSTRTAVKEVLKKVLKDRNILSKLTGVRSFDNYAFDHAINVCMISLMIGLCLPLSRKELYDLGAGALLHDIGMGKLEKKVLYKTTALTTDEMEMIKQHPFVGHEILLHIAGFPKEAAVIALQHHERFDGSGYPGGLKGDEIHRFAQIVSVADVFDALLADRPFRNAFYPHQAVDILANNRGKFATDVVDLLLDKVIIYPIGTRVKLNNGDIGVVVDTNKDHTRPILRMETSGERLLTNYQEADLSKHQELFIVKVIRNQYDGDNN